MPSNTSNVKIGVCRVYFGGHDLGYTQGGVEVSVATETHKVVVDQFGRTPIAESIMGREVKVKVPMAETTFENLVAVMPGATLVAASGAKATGTITITTNPADGETITVNGKTVTFKTAAAGLLQVTLGATAALTAANLATVLNGSTDAAIVVAEYTEVGAVVTVTYDTFGTAGNAFTLVTGTAAVKVTMSAATLSGGVASGALRVSVTDGIAEGANLLTLAKELRLHPIAKADNDVTEDFVIPLAATPGGLNFAYQTEQERLYNVEFQGYPDPTTRRLFYIGE